MKSFSIKSLLLLLTLVAVALGAWSHAARRQLDNVSTIRALQGRVTYSTHACTWFSPPQAVVRGMGPDYFYTVDAAVLDHEVTPDGLRAVSDLGHLQSFTVHVSPAAQLGYLSEMSGDEEAHLRNELSAAFLELGRLADLRELHLLNLRELPPSLHSVSALNELAILELRGSGVTDLDMRWISAIPSLKTLNLSDTLISDSCISSLVKMTQLEELAIQGTEISPSGLQELATLSLVRLKIGREQLNSASSKSLKSFKALKVLMIRSNEDETSLTQDLARSVPNCSIIIFPQAREEPRLIDDR